MILTPSEFAALSAGRRKTVLIPEHEQRRRYRSPQGIKDRTIEEFAVRYTAQLERHGCNHLDVRHVNNLIALLDKVVQHNQRQEAKSKKRSAAA